jgi:hypothetical protein
MNKEGQWSASAKCHVHDWEVRRTFELGDRDATRWAVAGEATRWAVAQGGKHEAIFRQIAVERARAQVALDRQLQHLIDQKVIWMDEFDGKFLQGVVFIRVPLSTEETP